MNATNIQYPSDQKTSKAQAVELQDVINKVYVAGAVEGYHYGQQSVAKLIVHLAGTGKIAMSEGTDVQLSEFVMNSANTESPIELAVKVESPEQYPEFSPAKLIDSRRLRFRRALKEWTDD